MDSGIPTYDILPTGNSGLIEIIPGADTIYKRKEKLEYVSQPNEYSCGPTALQIC
jgi:hypothetical protein